jgi:hypothetical protein
MPAPATAVGDLGVGLGGDGDGDGGSVGRQYEYHSLAAAKVGITALVTDNRGMVVASMRRRKFLFTHNSTPSHCLCPASPSMAVSQYMFAGLNFLSPSAGVVDRCTPVSDPPLADVLPHPDTHSSPSPYTSPFYEPFNTSVLCLSCLSLSLFVCIRVVVVNLLSCVPA